MPLIGLITSTSLLLNSPFSAAESVSSYTSFSKSAFSATRRQCRYEEEKPIKACMAVVNTTKMAKQGLTNLRLI